VLILPQRDSEAAICHALEQGAGGYLLQGCSLAEIMSGIRLVCRGSIPLAPLAASKLAERLTQQSPLTPREVDILRQMMRGLSNKSIALKLDLAVGTVKTHVKSIFSKLHAGSRTQAVTVAQRRGILLEDEEGTSSRSSLSWSQGFQRPPRASSTQTCSSARAASEAATAVSAAAGVASTLGTSRTQVRPNRTKECVSNAGPRR
jgi:DNA-binding CsgD family transcriptional regulator